MVKKCSSFRLCYSSLLLEGLCILGKRVIKKNTDELGFVGVALQSSNFRQRLVFLGTDVCTCQLRSGLSLIWHVRKGVRELAGQTIMLEFPLPSIQHHHESSELWLHIPATTI